MPFQGFPEGKARQIRIPEAFFRQLLPQIDHLDELKLTLYVFWRLERMEGAFRFLRFRDLLHDADLLGAFGATPAQAQAALADALERAVRRGTLLQAAVSVEGGEEQLIFLNSPRGRAAVESIQRGEWRFTGDPQQPLTIYQERPNIFQMYESNLGPLTPMIADALRDAETTYPAEWIEDAIRIAVERNKRSWRYVDAILRRWQQEGRHDRKEKGQDRRDSEEARRRYAEWEK
jgi:DNA replication protein